MSQELLYTSAPQGLKPGSHGFCIVACTQGMPASMTKRLESLSGYKHLFPPPDPQAALNPVVWSHLLVPMAERRHHVLSRIGAAGLDYTHRTNHLAHHVVLDANESSPAGPAWLLTVPSLMQTAWDGQVGLLQEGRTIPHGEGGPTICRHWEQLTGDAGWGGVLAEAAANTRRTLVTVLFSPGMDLLPLVAESLALLTPAQRWKVTFSTYYTRLPPDIECQWRFVIAGSAEADAAHRTAGMRVIDLTSPLGATHPSRFVDYARIGKPTFRSPLPPPLPQANQPDALLDDEAAELLDDALSLAPPPIHGKHDRHTSPDHTAPPALPNGHGNRDAFAFEEKPKRRLYKSISIAISLVLFAAATFAAVHYRSQIRNSLHYRPTVEQSTSHTLPVSEPDNSLTQATAVDDSEAQSSQTPTPSKAQLAVGEQPEGVSSEPAGRQFEKTTTLLRDVMDTQKKQAATATDYQRDKEADGTAPDQPNGEKHSPDKNGTHTHDNRIPTATRPIEQSSATKPSSTVDSRHPRESVPKWVELYNGGSPSVFRIDIAVALERTLADYDMRYLSVNAIANESCPLFLERKLKGSSQPTWEIRHRHPAPGEPPYLGKVTLNQATVALEVTNPQSFELLRNGFLTLEAKGTTPRYIQLRLPEVRPSTLSLNLLTEKGAPRSRSYPIAMSDLPEKADLKVELTGVSGPSNIAARANNSEELQVDYLLDERERPTSATGVRQKSVRIYAYIDKAASEPRVHIEAWISAKDWLAEIDQALRAMNKQIDNKKSLQLDPKSDQFAELERMESEYDLRVRQRKAAAANLTNGDVRANLMLIELRREYLDQRRGQLFRSALRVVESLPRIKSQPAFTDVEDVFAYVELLKQNIKGYVAPQALNAIQNDYEALLVHQWHAAKLEEVVESILGHGSKCTLKARVYAEVKDGEFQPPRFILLELTDQANAPKTGGDGRG